ncbi:MAG: hypothetical protein ACAI43_21835, partial [Phycisphaerae bacterium]|nr:hypothetical protein [Tepidisphaeraceae bacterium]
HPDYLAFFNRLSGGPARGQEVLADSNIDWGQDVARLARYLETEQRGRPYAFKVSGARVPALVDLLGLNPKSRVLTANELEAGSTDGVDPRELRKRPRGLLALGINAKVRLEETRLVDGKPVLGPDFSWVSKYPLIKRIGGSIEVYDLEPETGSPSGR